MRAGCLILLPMLALAGCAEQSVLQYQGRPAQTAQECAAAHAEAKARPVQTDYSSGGAMIGSALGKGIAKGMIDSHYEACLQRVSAPAVAVIDTRQGAAVPAAVAAPKPAAGSAQSRSPGAEIRGAGISGGISGGVPNCGLVMVGGSGYACAAGQ